MTYSCRVSFAILDKKEKEIIRYFCGGVCRGTAFNSSGNIKPSHPNCQKKENNLLLSVGFSEKDSLFNLPRKDDAEWKKNT